MKHVRNVIKALAAGVTVYVLQKIPYRPGEPRVIVCDTYPNCTIPVNMVIPSSVSLSSDVTFESGVVHSTNIVPLNNIVDIPAESLSNSISTSTCSIICNNNIFWDVNSPQYEFGSSRTSNVDAPSNELISQWSQAICLAANRYQLIPQSKLIQELVNPTSFRPTHSFDKHAINLKEGYSQHEASASQVEFIKKDLSKKKPKQEYSVQQTIRPKDLSLEILAKLILRIAKIGEHHTYFIMWLILYTMGTIGSGFRKILNPWLIVVNCWKAMKKVWKLVDYYWCVSETECTKKEYMETSLPTIHRDMTDNLHLYCEDETETTDIDSPINIEYITAKGADEEMNSSIEAFQEQATSASSVYNMPEDGQEDSLGSGANEVGLPVVENTIIVEPTNMVKDITMRAPINMKDEDAMRYEYEVPSPRNCDDSNVKSINRETKRKLTPEIIHLTPYEYRPLEQSHEFSIEMDIAEHFPKKSTKKTEYSTLECPYEEQSAPKSISGEELLSEDQGNNIVPLHIPKLHYDNGYQSIVTRRQRTSCPSPRRVRFQLPNNDKENHDIAMKSLKPMKVIIDFLRSIRNETLNQTSNKSSSFFNRYSRGKFVPVFKNYKAFFTRLGNIGSVTIDEPQDLSDAYSIIQAFGPMIEEYHSIMVSVPAVLKDMIEGTHNLLSILQEVEVWFGAEELTQCDRELAVHFCIMIVQCKGDVRLVCNNINFSEVPQNMKVLLETKKTVLRGILSQLETMERTYTMLPIDQAETIIADGMNKLASVFRDGMLSVERRRVMDSNKVLISAITTDMIDLIENIDIYKEELKELKELGAQLEVNLLGISEHLQANCLLIRVAEAFDLENLSGIVAEYLRLLNDNKASYDVMRCHRLFAESAQRAKQ